jgi:hypothetical protein
VDQPSDRMTQPRGIGQARQAQAALRHTRLDRAVSWSDARTAVGYDAANRMLLAVPATSAKRAEHPWLVDAVTVHTRIGDAEGAGRRPRGARPGRIPLRAARLNRAPGRRAVRLSRWSRARRANS